METQTAEEPISVPEKEPSVGSEPFVQPDIEENEPIGEQEPLNGEEQPSEQPIAAEVQLEGSTEPFVTGEIPQSENEASGMFGEIPQSENEAAGMFGSSDDATDPFAQVVSFCTNYLRCDW